MIHVLGTETKETEMIDDEDAPSGDDFNQPLRQLAQEAQRHPHESVPRQLALNKLVNEILKSDRLGHPQRGLWSPSVGKKTIIKRGLPTRRNRKVNQQLAFSPSII
ncbi:MAG: hypothetical protein BRC37_14465 [Cyanobacteria bacterium QH_3_48_40]|nr:MAG: hypothetical protein BRC37_14465 [Cyanobacteria bacterium QH_3_48_40]